MPRAALRLLIGIALMGLSPAARALDPHMDPGTLPSGCPACHSGHGASGSPMLPEPQVPLCLSCHESQAGLERKAARGDVSRLGRSTFLASTLASPFVHPMSDRAFSRRDPGVVCTSCHSPHRGLPPRSAGARAVGAGVRKVSPRDPNRFEYQLCEGCHGGEGLTSPSPLDISRLVNQTSRSYHPIEAPSPESSASVVPGLSGREINCTDCHGNSDPGGARGPHGSGVRYILRAPYATVDGGAEAPATYALCYDCHDRDRVLDSTSFPYHRLHVVEQRASCATCHNPHGSLKNRALIRFGEETLPIGVSPSIGAGMLAFDSGGPGSGSCYLTCHGSDHAPKSYGGMAPSPVQGIAPGPAALRP